MKKTENMKDYQKNYYEKNKKDILDKRKERVRCKVCDKDYAKGYIKRHEVKHKLMKQIN